MAYGKTPKTKPLLAKEKSLLYNNKTNVVQKEPVMAAAPAEPMLFSHFRAHLFQVADAALASGEPVPLERNGQRLWLVPERTESRIDRLPVLDIIVGDADDLIRIDTSEWNETRNLS